MARPREADRKDLKPLVLKAANELFISQGYQQITMRKIAGRAGCTPAAIYNYFASKEEILFELHNQGFKLLFEYTAHDSASPATSAVERLRRQGRRYIDFALEHPERYELMFNLPEPRDFYQRVKKNPGECRYGEGEDYGLRSYSLLTEAIEQCQKEGYFKGIDSDMAAFTLWSLVHGAVSLIIRGHGPLPNQSGRESAYVVVDFMTKLSAKGEAC